MARQVDDNTFGKKQDDLYEFSINYGDNWLGSDTIATGSWDVPSGLHEVSQTFDDDVSTLWVSGGVINQTYTLVNHITTAAGRIKRESIYLRIEENDA